MGWSPSLFLLGTDFHTADSSSLALSGLALLSLAIRCGGSMGVFLAATVFLEVRLFMCGQFNPPQLQRGQVREGICTFLPCMQGSDLIRQCCRIQILECVNSL